MQIATANQLVLMGAKVRIQVVYNYCLICILQKVNEMIAQGQFYRLLTPIFLHGNIAHLLVNCYSLYSLGSTVERCFGLYRTIGWKME
jgi:rhomboid protease GluP